MWDILALRLQRNLSDKHDYVNSDVVPIYWLARLSGLSHANSASQLVNISPIRASMGPLYLALESAASQRVADVLRSQR